MLLWWDIDLLRTVVVKDALRDRELRLRPDICNPLNHNISINLLYVLQAYLAIIPSIDEQERSIRLIGGIKLE